MTHLSASRPLAPAEVVALCRELRDVLAAGVPLHLGLKSGGAVTPRLERVLERLIERSTQGEDLPTALEAESDVIPPMLRGVVLAGLRTGRVDELLEDLSRATESLDSLRLLLLRSLLYPVFVVLLSAVLSLFLLPRLIENLRIVYEGAEPQGLAAFVLHGEWWIVNAGWMVLAAVLACWLLNWFVARERGDELTAWGLLANLPILNRVLHDRVLARVTHLLALLVKYGVPLPEALSIAAESTSEGPFRRELQLLATQAAAGNEFTYARASRFPGFLQWMITLGQKESRLSDALQDAAAYYQSRSLFRAEWVSRVFPACVMIVLGGGFALFYSLIVYGPLMSLWQHLGIE